MVEKLSFEQYRKNHPLLDFSVYTNIQVEVIDKLGQDICSDLDQAITGTVVDAQKFNSVYGKFWLWVLGAYEITRTMVVSKACFSAVVQKRLREFLNRIEKLRIPFAKQEYSKAKGKGTTVANELSVSNIDLNNKDLIFKVQNEDFLVRKVISDFSNLIESITSNDILLDHRKRNIQTKVG